MLSPDHNLITLLKVNAIGNVARRNVEESPQNASAISTVYIIDVGVFK